MLMHTCTVSMTGREGIENRKVVVSSSEEEEKDKTLPQQTY